MALYTYLCEPCKALNITISEGDPAGVVTELRHIEDRNKESLCPHCGTKMIRDTVPETIGVWWGNPYNNKKILLGPTQDKYPRDAEIARKNATRHHDMSPREIVERKAELREDFHNRPKKAEDCPPPGVSKAKE